MLDRIDLWVRHFSRFSRSGFQSIAAQNRQTRVVLPRYVADPLTGP